MSDLSIGDVVRLKSSGPEMTIEDIDDYGPQYSSPAVKCVWFLAHIRKEGIFNPATLEKVDQDDVPPSPVLRG